LPPAGAPLARSSGAWPFRDSWLLDSPFRSALRCLPGSSQLCRRLSHPLLALVTATGFSRLCRRPSHPLPGFSMASADFSLRSSGDARRPFGHKARSPQVRVVNFPAQPLDIRRHPLVVRASRTDARSPWVASPRIHRTPFSMEGVLPVRRLAVSLSLLSVPASRLDRFPGLFTLRVARGRYDQLPQRTSTSYSRPCWAHVG
jgi:hypothetical protein